MTKLEQVIDSLGRCTCHVPDACRDCAYDDKPAPDCWLTLECDALELLKEQQSTINAELVKHGYWEPGFLAWVCSNCGYDISCLDRSQYCPNCGAKMDMSEPPKEGMHE